MWFDKTGRADTSFHGIVLHALKKATFNSPRYANAKNILKLVVNGVTYNITETAQNGAVLLTDSASSWQFIAPNDRLKFSDYYQMTFGEALVALEADIHPRPIPAWDAFCAYIGRQLKNTNFADDATLAKMDCFLSVSHLGDIKIGVPNLGQMTSFHDLITSIISVTENAASIPMTAFKIYDTDKHMQFSLKIISYKEDGSSSSLNITMSFRE